MLVKLFLIMNKLEKKLAYKFSNISLLKQALTHKSSNIKNNERLEFLGDSILGLVIAIHIYNKFRDINEGTLTRLRSSLVKGETLCMIANELELGKELMLGKGELKTGGASRCSILEDALEAVFGAIFLDSNFEVTKRVILSVYKDRLKNISADTVKDYKTTLQEYLQKHKLLLPKYSLVNTTGDEHNVLHTILCELDIPKIKVEKTAGSIKYAEQDCAKFLLETIAKGIAKNKNGK